MRVLLLACAAASAPFSRDGAAAPAPATAVFLLKHGRSGSTWLTALLNSMPGISVFEEAIKFKSLPTAFVEAQKPYEHWQPARDPATVDAKAAEELRRLLAAYLGTAAKHRVRSFHACTRGLVRPDDHTVEESCAVRGSPSGSGAGAAEAVAHGITFAFHHFAAFIDLSLLAQPSVRLVVHVRINVVKLAVSVKAMSHVKTLTTLAPGRQQAAARDADDGGGRARRKLRLCYANGQLEARGTCVSRAEAPFSPDVAALLEAVRLTILSNEVTCAAAARAARSGVAVHVTTYEAMQLNLDEALAAVGAFVGTEMPRAADESAAPKKRGSDDLRGTLANFDAVEAALANASWANADARPRLARLLRETAPDAADAADGLRIILPKCAALLAACETSAHERGSTLIK
ncbi:hypothetical protein M885DRAFT_556761 [Pelagophyceae sp. CCMP2097]|nr:hypothetical protein M885DRAFT_556761 [Pelagophyceae sp. CCMP2097]